MIIDTHVHIGEDKGGAKQNIDDLKRNMQAYGIDKAVIFPFDESEDLISKSIALTNYSNTNTIPFLRFDPKAVTPEQVENLLAEHPFRGVKLHTRAQNFDPLEKRYYPIYKKIEESGKPLLIHSSKITRFGKEASVNTDPERVVKLAPDFPGLNIIVAHMAAGSWEAMDVIAKTENLFMDTSINGTTFTMKMTVDRMGPEKLIFGSDAPYSDEEVELLKVKKADISQKDKDKILSRNISRLLGL